MQPSTRLKQRFLRLAARAVDRLPAPLRSTLFRLHQPVARYLAAAPYRRKYGGRFLSAIDDHDDLLHHGLPLARTQPAFHYYRAAQMYFEGGDWNAAEVEQVLAEAGFPIDRAGAFLEFAAGYGRLTRHFVQRLGPARITVSDIDSAAVDFVRARLGVKGFYSARTPAELTHDGRYDTIVVVSLFSHLPHDAWGPWLERLRRLLTPSGVLLFTTASDSEAGSHTVERHADGFLYRQQNETRGRLDTTHYGAAFVSEEYVRRAVAEHFDGRLVHSAPGALLIAQDAYVLQAGG